MNIFFKRLIIAPLLLLFCSTAHRNFSENEWAAEIGGADPRGLYAPHVRDGVYFNPWMPMKFRGFSELLFWRLTAKIEYANEEKSLPEVMPNALERIRAAGQRDFILWVGHNTFLIRAGGRYWLTDPVFSDRIVVVKRQTPPGITLKEILSITGDLNVIISHNHYDHLDGESVKEMPDSTSFHVPLGLKDFLSGLGKQNVIEMDWWQEHNLGGGVKIVCLPAQHWSRRIGQETNTTLWATFLIITSSASIFFAGDTGHFIGFREFGKKYPGIDYALFPVSAAHPRWFMHYAHMDVGEAMEAFRDLEARYFIPMHWGAFHLGDEPVGFAGVELERKIKEKGVDRKRYLLMKIGELVLINSGR